MDTLEPLMQVVQDAMIEAGWSVSGLQKTTSWMFEGRWEGHETRSAYVFFHRADLPEDVSIDVFLDETSDGLKGSLALVLPGGRLRELHNVPETLSRLQATSAMHLPKGYRRPISVRFRTGSPSADPMDAEGDCRIKLHFPRAALEASPGVVQAVCRVAVNGFESILEDPTLSEWGARPPEDLPSD